MDVLGEGTRYLHPLQLLGDEDGRNYECWMGPCVLGDGEKE